MSVHGPRGLTISTTATITDYRELGREVAEHDSQQQAEFLAGFAEALHMLQSTYIADDVNRGNAADAIAETFDTIVRLIKKGAS